jgi:hexosaminidase
MFKFFIYTSWLIGFQTILFSQQGIIPQPVEATWATNSAVFNMAPTAYILANDFEAFKDAVAFRDLSIRFLDLPLKTATKKMGNGPAITVQYDSASTLPPGGYELIITPLSITITGSPDGGVFHGLMSLLQLIEGEKSTGYSIPCGRIVDYPRFNWRGMHLDVSRHFFDVDDVKEYIDYLALYKFNTFHWHLTDDQGWRIEIKQYPKLTEIGAWRKGSTVGHYSDNAFDSIRYGGYYTQEEIAEVVAYAAKRRITMVPEIEMPGHALAALAAYPEFACTEGPFEVGMKYGVYEDVFCPKEETFVFLENILAEVMALFPSAVIHIGGDEVLKNRWKSCSHCQALMQAKGLPNEEALQSYFIQRIEKFVNSHGRVIIGWDEILEGGLAPNAMVMSWRGTEGGIAAAKSGHQVVMSPNSDCYFDHYQGDPKNEPLAIGGMTTLQDVYAYEPIPEALTDQEAAFIIGAQANIWTEYILNFDQVEYMAMPRMIALSEVLWSPASSRNFADFRQRLTKNLQLLDQVRVNYSRTWMTQE